MCIAAGCHCQHFTPQPQPATSDTIKVLGSGGDYEDWPKPATEGKEGDEKCNAPADTATCHVQSTPTQVTSSAPKLSDTETSRGDDLPICSFCNWTNIGLLNIGETNQKLVLICHGCVKRQRDQLTQLQADCAAYAHIIIEMDNDLKENLPEYERLESVQRFFDTYPQNPGAALLKEIERLKEEVKQLRARIPLHFIKTLDAKWLDPECHDGCQSLILKSQVESLTKKLDEANWELPRLREENIRLQGSTRLGYREDRRKLEDEIKSLKSQVQDLTAQIAIAKNIMNAQELRLRELGDDPSEAVAVIGEPIHPAYKERDAAEAKVRDLAAQLARYKRSDNFMKSYIVYMLMVILLSFLFVTLGILILSYGQWLFQILKIR